MAFDTKDRGTQLMAVLIILIAGAWFAFYNIILSPSQEEINKKEKELGELQNKYHMAKRVADRLPDAKKELKNLEKQWEHAQKKLPEQRQIEQLLVQLTSMGMRTGIKFNEFTPAPPRAPKGFYRENVVSISVDGTYHQLAYFFNQIANLTRIVKVDRVNISYVRKSSENNEQVYTIQADFEAIAYAFVKGGGAPSNESKKAKEKS